MYVIELSSTLEPDVVEQHMDTLMWLDTKYKHTIIVLLCDISHLSGIKL
jgi:hypothetical protein